MKKYEYTGEQKEISGVILHQIRAVRDFGAVHAGEIGGWIESEENLSHENDAWASGGARVFGNAQVYGGAHVSGNAQVFGNAQVYGDAHVSGYAQVFGYARVYGNALVFGGARVYGDAHVSGNAQVFGGAWVYGDALVHGGKWEHSPCFIQGTRWSMNVSSPDTVRCGCQDHSWETWHNHYAEISRSHNGDDVLDEYIQYFNLLCGLYGHEDCRIVRREKSEDPSP